MTEPDFDAAPAATHEQPDEDSAAIIAGLRRELTEAGPRLEAFAHLESLAAEQATTPEAIALQASIDVLRAEKADVEQQVDDLKHNHKKHVEERDMLIKQKEQVSDDLVIVLDEHTVIVEELAELIEELESMRSDAVRLLGEKSALEMRIEALRNEASALGGEVSRRAEFETVTDDDEEQATAFDAFFEADVVEDKARAWMLE